MATLNRIRRDHPALSRLRSLRMWPSTNPQIFAYSKVNDGGTDCVLTVVNLDPSNARRRSCPSTGPRSGFRRTSRSRFSTSSRGETTRGSVIGPLSGWIRSTAWLTFFP